VSTGWVKPLSDVPCVFIITSLFILHLLTCVCIVWGTSLPPLCFLQNIAKDLDLLRVEGH
jgi:hypothetical protein